MYLSAHKLKLTQECCRWGLGAMALRKKQLVAEGKLDKHGLSLCQSSGEVLAK